MNTYRPFLLEFINARDLPHVPHFDHEAGEAAARPPIFEQLEAKVNNSTDLIQVMYCVYGICAYINMCVCVKQFDLTQVMYCVYGICAYINVCVCV